MEQSKKIVIVGAGGFGREVLWLIERINEKKLCWKVAGFIDDAMECNHTINQIPVLGSLERLEMQQEEINVVCAIGSAKIRKTVVERLKKNPKLQFPNMVDPSVSYSKYIKMGEGNIVCAETILTTNIKLGDFNILNLSCTVGHDVKIKNFVTVYPGVNISGNVKVGAESELGTGTKIIQGKQIGDQVIVGAGAVVVADLTEAGTYIGVPAKQLL